MNQVVNRVRVNWYSLIPEIARLGKKGRVVILFTIQAIIFAPVAKRFMGVFRNQVAGPAQVRIPFRSNTAAVDGFQWITYRLEVVGHDRVEVAAGFRDLGVLPDAGGRQIRPCAAVLDIAQGSG